MTAERTPEDQVLPEYPGRAPVVPGIRFADLPNPVVERSRLRIVAWITIVVVVLGAAAGIAWLAATGEISDLLSIV